jgi:hypothetical protein
MPQRSTVADLRRMCHEWVMHEPHPIKLVVEDDLKRTRLTVAFRLVLAIPHFIWIALWSIAVVVVAVVGWLAAVASGRLPGAFHRFFCSYVRYAVHLAAYLSIVADPYPGFGGAAGSYPVDVQLPEGPEDQSRRGIVVRILLAIPALIFSVGLGGGSGTISGRGGSTRSTSAGTNGLSGVTAILGWFASVFTARMPRGLRDAGAYTIGYRAQALAYILLLTPRYPSADPTSMLAGLERPPLHPVHIVGDSGDLRRSRLTVLFRLVLAIPHLVWLALCGIAAGLVAIVQWFATLIQGRPAAKLHEFLSRYVRYAFHVNAYVCLVANPFPGFSGRPGLYPLDLELPGPQPQNRWKTAFRIVLALPAILVSAGLGGVLVAAALLSWFASLVQGSAPEGLRNASAYALRYGGQVNAYVFLLTEVYPHSSPLEGASPGDTFELEPAV